MTIRRQFARKYLKFLRLKIKNAKIKLLFNLCLPVCIIQLQTSGPVQLGIHILLQCLSENSLEHVVIEMQQRLLQLPLAHCLTHALPRINHMLLHHLAQITDVTLELADARLECEHLLELLVLLLDLHKEYFELSSLLVELLHGLISVTILLYAIIDPLRHVPIANVDRAEPARKLTRILLKRLLALILVLRNNPRQLIQIDALGPLGLHQINLYARNIFVESIQLMCYNIVLLQPLHQLRVIHLHKILVSRLQRHNLLVNVVVVRQLRRPPIKPSLALLSQVLHGALSLPQLRLRIEDRGLVVEQGLHGIYDYLADLLLEFHEVELFEVHFSLFCCEVGDAFANSHHFELCLLAAYCSLGTLRRCHRLPHPLLPALHYSRCTQRTSWHLLRRDTTTTHQPALLTTIQVLLVLCLQGCRFHKMGN